MSHKNLGEMFKSVCERFADKAGMMYKKDGVYHSVPYRELMKTAFKIAGGLKKFGIKKGDKVLLLSENRVEWALVDYAILTVGGVTVPIYPTLLASHIEFIINNSEGQLIFVSDSMQLEKIQKISKNLPKLKNIILMEGEPPKDIHPWQEFLETGETVLKENPAFIDERLSNIDRDDLASIIYTSGTTGIPKGVMLTHGNFLSNIEGALQSLYVDENDVFLSFLPLSHVFERMAGHFLALYCGATIAYAESIETVGDNLKEVRPTVMTSVPRFFEKVYARILEGLEEGSALKRKIFFWAVEVGKKAILYKQKGKALTGLLNTKYKLADKLVYSKLKEQVGGRTRMFISGGAPLSKDINEFFNAAGLVLLEGYGLTETSPVISVNKIDHFKFGSTGLPLPNVEVAIAEDGEILTRGPHVMKGYYKNDEETREVLDDQNWLHTGDIGYLDKDGFLYITDRKKNIIVTSGGKNIAPQAIENMLIKSKYVEQALVIGDNRKYCTALIVPNMENLKSFAEAKQIAYQDEDRLISLPEITNLIQQEIDALSMDLASYETIKKFKLFKEPFSIESGDLTPTLKVKRNVVEQKYKKIIDEMYAEDESMV